MTEYDREVTEAEKLFWSNIKAAMANSSTQTRIAIKKEVEDVKKCVLEIQYATKKSGSILKTWANMIKQGAKDLRE
jgi:hypothetical protein